MLGVSDIQEANLRQNFQEDILKTLTSLSMTGRYEEIVKPFPENFNWVFEDCTAEQIPWSNFPEWLKTGSGVYWISGKAGSGKSTLMKHIFDDVRTREFLESWARKDAGDSEMGRRIQFCLAPFFYWYSGTPEQKSQNGLLRALLHQVLSSPPELINSEIMLVKSSLGYLRTNLWLLPSVRLQYLTYHDNEHYVSSKFNHNPAFARLQESDFDAARLLQNEVIEKAEGVFLWVEIVVRSLVFGTATTTTSRYYVKDAFLCHKS